MIFLYDHRRSRGVECKIKIDGVGFGVIDSGSGVAAMLRSFDVVVRRMWRGAPSWFVESGVYEEQRSEHPSEFWSFVPARPFPLASSLSANQPAPVVIISSPLPVVAPRASAQPTAHAKDRRHRHRHHLICTCFPSLPLHPVSHGLIWRSVSRSVQCRAQSPCHWRLIVCFSNVTSVFLCNVCSF